MNQNKVIITMFGGFSMTLHAHSIGNDSSNSQKMWELLSYLITHKGRETSTQNLIDTLWEDEDLTNPTNALKTLVYRTRLALNELGLSGKDLLASRHGSYYWNDAAIETVVDIDQFESCCKRAESSTDPDEIILLANQALSLYHGDFLSNITDARWTIPLSTYYENMLTKIIDQALDAYQKREAYEEALELCTNALLVLPYDEPLNIRSIETLLHLGRAHIALTQYNRVDHMFKVQFGSERSEEFKSLKAKIIKANHLPLPEKTHLPKKDMTEHEGGALFCSGEVFDIICYYDAQTKARYGGNDAHASLVIITIAELTTQPSRMAQKASVLKETIRNTLRSSDCFCQRSQKQFELLLQNTDAETAEIVLHRLLKHFNQTLNKKNILCHIEYTIEEMEIPKSIRR